MSRKLTIQPQKIIDAGDASGTLTSYELDVLHLDDVGIQVKWTGVVDGTLSVQVSISGTDWSELDNQTLSSSTNPYVASYAVQPFSKFRVVFTNTSGTGTLTVWADAHAI
jgi:hypothetical protein